MIPEEEDKAALNSIATFSCFQIERQFLRSLNAHCYKIWSFKQMMAPHYPLPYSSDLFWMSGQIKIISYAAAMKNMQLRLHLIDSIHSRTRRVRILEFSIDFYSFLYIELEFYRFECICEHFFNGPKLMPGVLAESRFISLPISWKLTLIYLVHVQANC